jgi:transposase
MRGSYPGALRRRVIDFVEAGGSRREAAEQFDVSVSSAIRWLQHFRNDRRSEPMPSGGSVSPLEKHAQRIFTLIAEQSDASGRTFGRSIPLNVWAISGMRAMNHRDWDAL